MKWYMDSFYTSSEEEVAFPQGNDGGGIINYPGG